MKRLVLFIIKGIYPSVDEEAMRIIREGPNWIPGTQDGKKIRRFTIPILFSL